jgi:hypothetical protein
MNQSQQCQFGLAKWFCPTTFAQFAEAGERHSKALHLPEHLPEKSITTGPFFFFSHWLIMMIGPGDLLLAVSHLFAVPVLVLCVGLEK